MGMTANRPALELEGLCGGWDETRVVQHVSLAVEPGETVAIVGRNGVGKTTLLELIAGRGTRHAGRIRINGTDVFSDEPLERWRARMGYVPQQREVFTTLTVRENLAIALRPGRWDLATLMGLFPSLEPRLSNLGQHLSGGEQQMLSIARALAGNPALLVMDEPTEGLAPIVVEQLVQALAAVAQDDELAIVLVEQRLDIALAFAERCIVMDAGCLVHDGPSIDLQHDERRLAELMGLFEAVPE